MYTFEVDDGDLRLLVIGLGSELESEGLDRAALKADFLGERVSPYDCCSPLAFLILRLVKSESLT